MDDKGDQESKILGSPPIVEYWMQKPINLRQFKLLEKGIVLLKLSSRSVLTT